MKKVWLKSGTIWPETWCKLSVQFWIRVLLRHFSFYQKSIKGSISSPTGNWSAFVIIFEYLYVLYVLCNLSNSSLTHSCLHTIPQYRQYFFLPYSPHLLLFSSPLRPSFVTVGLTLRSLVLIILNKLRNWDTLKQPTSSNIQFHIV